MDSIRTELLIAAFDLGLFLSNRPLRITNEKLRKAEGILKQSKSEIKTFFNEPIDNSALKNDLPVSLYKTFADVIRDVTTTKELISRFTKIQGESELTDAITMSLSLILSELNARLPVNQSETLFGSKDIEPSDYEKMKFMQIVRTIEDPTYPLQLMNHGQLTQTEVDALQLFYPNLAQQYKLMIIEELALHVGKDNESSSSTKLGRLKQHQLGVMLGVARLTPAEIVNLQKTYTSKEDLDAQENMSVAPSGGPQMILGNSLSEVNNVQYRKQMK